MVISFEGMNNEQIDSLLKKEWDGNEMQKEFIEYEKKKIYLMLKDKFLYYLSGKNQRIPEATELIVQYILKNNYIYTTKDDIKSEMWIYKDGIYVPQGKSEVKELMRDILEEWFNMYFYNQVIAKIEADTFIDSNKFFDIYYPEEIAIKNGILNVFTRELKAFDPKKIFFNKIPVEYDPKAICPSIDLFLNDVLPNQEDKLVFYELAGFGLLKEYRYEQAAMFVGNGRNGKGKTLELLKRLVGPENCASLPLSSLMPESFAISELFCKFFNLAGDIGHDDLKDTSMFKALTGRDLVTAKRKFLNGLNFENYAKFIFACNELPTVYDTTRGFWDRWILLEFPYTFVTKEEFESAKDKTNLKIKDENIINKIITKEELSGFLNQALEGLERLDKNKKFSMTKGTQEIKELWIRKANSFVAFAFDFLIEDYDNHIPKKELRKRYADFCKKHGVPGKSDFVIKKTLQEMFGANDERIGYPDSIHVWQGVKWKSSV